MSENVSQNNYSGVGFLGLLTILFIALKLTGYIDWSWFWVLSPLIASIALALIFFGFLAYIMLKFKVMITKHF